MRPPSPGCNHRAGGHRGAPCCWHRALGHGGFGSQRPGIWSCAGNPGALSLRHGPSAPDCCSGQLHTANTAWKSTVHRAEHPGNGNGQGAAGAGAGKSLAQSKSGFGEV